MTQMEIKSSNVPMAAAVEDKISENNNSRIIVRSTGRELCEKKINIFQNSNLKHKQSEFFLLLLLL